MAIQVEVITNLPMQPGDAFTFVEKLSREADRRTNVTCIQKDGTQSTRRIDIMGPRGDNFGELYNQLVDEKTKVVIIEKDEDNT